MSERPVAICCTLALLPVLAGNQSTCLYGRFLTLSHPQLAAAASFLPFVGVGTYVKNYK